MKVAIIPARGGSKRIPRKNIREFYGKPMIAYSVECALSGSLFDRVIVSTDDEEIAAVARKYGAEVPFLRPRELADDFTGTTDVIAHATQWLQADGGDISSVCCIYATAPFICHEDLHKGLMLLEGGSWQYVFSATTYAFPIFVPSGRVLKAGWRCFFLNIFRRGRRICQRHCMMRASSTGAGRRHGCKS